MAGESHILGQHIVAGQIHTGGHAHLACQLPYALYQSVVLHQIALDVEPPDTIKQPLVHFTGTQGRGCSQTSAKGALARGRDECAGHSGVQR